MTKSFSDRVAEGKANHGTITPVELKAKMDANEGVTVVDVRDSNALGEGVIPGAKNVSLGTHKVLMATYFLHPRRHA